jgi:ADP-ribosylglycohydrolase
MIGAIAGDVVGSIYEFRNLRSKEFELFGPKCRFTDDSVLTVACAECILTGRDYADALRDYVARYPRRGYGGMFRRWASTPGMGPYRSYGNGSAMRVSPVGFAYGSLEEVLRKAKEFSAVTHDHPEGIRGAQAVASAIFLARTGATKEEIASHVTGSFRYDLTRTCDEIRKVNEFDETCPGSVPEAITAFLESDGFEDAIRTAVSLGGDSDTIACMTGGIAQAFYGVPPEIEEKALSLLDEPLRAVVLEFTEKHIRRHA